MNDDTTTQKTLAPAIFLEGGSDASEALRRIARQIEELAKEIDAGKARPLAGAGMVGRIEEAKVWIVDLQLSFEIVTGKAH